MSPLLSKQVTHTMMVCQLVEEMFRRGYVAKFAFAKRCNDCKIGHKKSLHKQQLAVDIDLFKVYDNGSTEYLNRTEDHEQFGLLWESWGGTWGGRWEDGNHYSMAHEGMK